MLPDRLIGRFTGSTHGPLVLVIGGLHGNEPAGVQALQEVLALLERESQPENFRGRLTALRGNRRALARGVRFLERDLNRMLTPANAAVVLATEATNPRPEELELRELLETIDAEIADYQPKRLFLLDLHTTTAEGGIFVIPSNDAESVQLGLQMHAPVITGMLEGLSGTTLHFFQDGRLPCRTVALTFEAGQHDNPLSVKRCVAAVINLLQSVGCVPVGEVHNTYDALLREHSAGLPRVSRLAYRHHIEPEDGFRMRPGFRNFNPVKKGDILADDRQGPVHAPLSGRMLMPLYQPQGEDGFFIIQEINSRQFAVGSLQ